MNWPAFFFLLFFVLALVGLIEGVYCLYLSRLSLRWTIWPARIVKNRIRRYISPGEGLPWQHEFQAEYEVGTRKFYLNLPCPSWPSTSMLGSYGLKLARNVVYKFPVDSEVKIWVDPQRPKRAVLLPGINRLCWIKLIATPTLFAALAAVCYVRYLSI